MPKSEYADWLTKAEAAQALQCAEKTIERLAAKGEIHQAFRPVPGRRPVAVFHPKDIEKLKPKNVAVPFVLSQSEAGPNGAAETQALVPVGKAPADLLAALASALGKPTALSVDKKLFLTIREAAEYSGLPKSYLRKLLKEGSLPSLRAGGYRIKRSDLERL
jgi:excisionase family DNA binding protein